MENAQIAKIVLASLKSILEEKNISEVSTLDTNTKLIGDNAVVESIGLVNLIADVEEILDDEYGHVITIADERAMSRVKSPFIDVNALCEYITELIQESKANG